MSVRQRSSVWGVLLFAVACTANVLASAAGVQMVTAHGAVGDGRTLNTRAFAAAVAACVKAGGGTVLVPPGRYLTGSIRLESNLTLHLEAGAELLYSGNPEDSPLVRSRWEGTNVYTHAPLIYAAGAENITITGRGTINGQGELWWWRSGATDPSRREEAAAMRDAWRALYERIEAGEAVTPEDFTVAAGHLRPSLVVPYACRNVRIEGVTITNSPMWLLHPIYCEDVVITGVRFISHGPNGDGLDVDSCRNVRVSDCSFDTNDDCIAIKSGRNSDGRRTARPSEYITITNCVMNRGHGAVAIGSETSGDVRYVTATNIVCNGTDFGIRLKTQRARGGVVEHIRYSDWVIRGGKEEAIEVTSDYRRDLPDEPFSERTPILRDIVISHVTVIDAAEVLNLNGLPEQYVENIRLTDIRGNGRTGFECLEADGVVAEGLQIDASEGPPYIIANSRNLRLRGLTTTRPAAGAMIRMENVADARLVGSRALAGTPVFVDVAGGGSRDIRLADNEVSADTEYVRRGPGMSEGAIILEP